MCEFSCRVPARRSRLPSVPLMECNKLISQTFRDIDAFSVGMAEKYFSSMSILPTDSPWPFHPTFRMCQKFLLPPSAVTLPPLFAGWHGQCGTPLNPAGENARNALIARSTWHVRTARTT
jgi:hypothetical protein